MRSHRTLAILTVVSILCYVWAENSRVVVRTPHYDDMLAAAEWMQAAMDTLRTAQESRGVFPDEINDPNQTGLIGQQYSVITTDIGDLETKWTALNPNVAGVMVNYLRDAGIGRGDVVAVGMTGSVPGLNLAFYAACEILDVHPLVITSVGSGSWGANDPNFTWLDMEHHLVQRQMLRYRSIAASYGGGEDKGQRLSPEGRNLIRESAERNDVIFIEESILENSVQRRLDLFNQFSTGQEIELYVNIGGGLASIGDARNLSPGMIPEGLCFPLPIRNYPRRGVIHSFSDHGTHILNIADVRIIAQEYQLPLNPMPLPEPGEGRLFSELRYNLWITALALVIVLLTLIIVLFYDRHAQRLDRDGEDPDTLV